MTGSAEAQVISGGIVKRLLIAYFIGNIYAKNIKIHSCAESYSKPKVGRLLRHGVLVYFLTLLIKIVDVVLLCLSVLNANTVSSC